MSTLAPVDYYLRAKRAVLAAGFGREIIWQASRDPALVTETEFLRESAWTILSAGMSEHVVRSRFPAVADAFLSFRSAAEIARDSEVCCTAAVTYFRHPGKIRAIATCATQVAAERFDQFFARVREDPVGVLQSLPYIGSITAFHLAKNLGFLLCKPDRHLSRIADAFGIDVHSLCQTIAARVGDDIRVVDVVLWRYAVIRGGKRWQQSDDDS